MGIKKQMADKNGMQMKSVLILVFSKWYEILSNRELVNDKFW